MKNYIKKYYMIYLIVISVVALDLITKQIFNDCNFSIINGVLSFTSSKNTGSAFSFFSDSTLFLTIFSAVFLIVIILIDKLFKFKGNLYKTSYALIISGAIGNLVDRILFGYVRDFIRLDFFDFTGINTVFNVADIAIVAGITLMIIYLVFFASKMEKKND